MKRVPDTKSAPGAESTPNEIRRRRWSAARSGSEVNRPSLSLISQARSRQRPLGPTWTGLIR